MVFTLAFASAGRCRLMDGRTAALKLWPLAAERLRPRVAPMPALVTVVIVAYQSGDYLQPCLDALAGQTFRDFEAVVADNGSPDGSVTRLTLPDARFQVQDMGGNLGFALANNRVAEQCRTEFLALLNPDAQPEAGWLQALVDAARRHPEAASFGSLQYRLEEPDVLDGVGDVWHVAGLAWRAGEGWAASRAPADGEIFSPCGAAALYRRAAFLDAGGFDARFFCYCEDLDLGHRLRAAGATSRRVSSAVVRHAGSGVSGRYSDFTMFHGHRNRIWTFVKNTPGPWFWLFLPYHVGFNLLYLGSAVRRRVFRPVWRSYVAAAVGIRPFLRERRTLASKRRTAFREMLSLVAWTPSAPFRRELRPRA
jgi:N-acetylglucosaminyl-diphospho-decaprenol L-rhamnosyltransferase